MSRTARIERTTKESDVLVELNLDGTGQVDVSTGVPFYDHMLSQLGKHGGLDLLVSTKGDLEVDAHHTVELIGTYDTTLTRHIWESIVASAQICLHVRVITGRNAHHIVEAQFKSVARALRDAVALDARVVGVPSTKGTLST